MQSSPAKSSGQSKILLVIFSTIIFLSLMFLFPSISSNAQVIDHAPKFSGKVKVPKKDGETKVEAYYSVEKLRDNVYHINDYSKSPGGKKGINPASMYLIKGSDKALLIDGGNKNIKARKELAAIVNKLRGTTPLEIAVTHNHEDHTGQLALFKANTIYYPKKDKVKDKHYTNNYSWVKEGDVIDLGNIKLNVIETPAHTPGSVTYVDQQNNLIASGDSIGSTFVWLFDKKSLNNYQKTLNHLYDQVKYTKDPLFMPGHKWQTDPANKKRGPKYTPDNKPMTMQYLKDMITLTKQIKDGTAKSHKYYVDGKKRGTAYVYHHAMICMIDD